MPDSLRCPLCDYDNPPSAHRCLSCNLPLPSSKVSPDDTSGGTTADWSPPPASPPAIPIHTIPPKLSHPITVDGPMAPLLRQLGAWITGAVGWFRRIYSRILDRIITHWVAWADSPLKRDVIPYAILLPLLIILSLLSPVLLVIGASLAAAFSNWVLNRKDLVTTSILIPLCMGLASLIV